MQKENFDGFLHDNKSALSGCLGLIEMVTDDWLNIANQADHLKYLGIASREIRKIINRFDQVMTINRLEEDFEKVQKNNLDLFAFLQNIIIIFEAEFKNQNIKFSKNPLSDSSDFKIMANESLLQRAVSNLVRNAVEEIIAKNYPESERLIFIQFGNNGREVIIEVANRSDISADQASSFFRANHFSTKISGHGLGTKVINAVARAHGGAASAIKEGGFIKVGIKIPNN